MHSGHYSGTIEAQKLGIRPEDIKLGGRWVHGNGRMDQHYMSNIPISFAFGMAGFKDGKPFHLKRNEKAPPVELQEKIFPFIETAFGEPGSEGNKRWRQECLDDMNEKDEDQPEQLDNILPFDPPASDPSIHPVHEAHFSMNKKRFFKFLIRLRRVILQDAVVYLHIFKSIKSPLLENDLFQSNLFLRFQDELVPILDEDDAPLLLDFPPIMADAIISQQQQHSSQFRQIIDQFQQLGLQVQQLQVQQLQVQQPVEQQVQQQGDQEDPFCLYMANEISKLQRSVHQLMLLLQDIHVLRPYGSYLSTAGPRPTFPYPPYAYGEQVQHHTAIYQLTSRVPWLRPTSPIPPIQPASSAAQPTQLIAPTQPSTMAPIQPPAWNPPQLLIQTNSIADTRPTQATTKVSGQEGAKSEESGSSFGFLQRPANTRQVWDERQRFTRFQEEYKKRNGKPARLVEKTWKALNNRLQIIEEVEFQVKQAQAGDSSYDRDKALEDAMKSLDSMGLSCNELHKFCVKEATKRGEPQA
ncbi:hypothetical protein BGZ59_001099 [Podila verticillata]|nr:hypothetical protein BGZ59_001099 [Podila verticillata]